MPSIRELEDHATQLLEDFIERRDRKVDAELLPPDLCAAVTARARAEAANTRAWMEKVSTELDRLRAELKTAEAKVRAEYVPVPGPVKVVGDILGGGSRVERTPSTVSLKSPKAVALNQAQVVPLKARIAALERELSSRHGDLAHLKQIVRLAGAGDVALLLHLTGAWRTRLEIGAAVFARLPEPARQLAARVDSTVPTDAAGNVLPGEALDADGKPDMPVTGEAVRDTLQRQPNPAWRRTEAERGKGGKR